MKIGFVSGDLYDHAVATFLEPVLAHLSRSARLSLHAYYNANVDDPVNRRLRGYFATWNDIFGISNADVAQQIAAAGIDILVDVSGHTAFNRLAVFARKPAPLQLSWLGYPGTTGLRAMDYFLADRHFLPPGRFDEHFTEKLIRLPAAAVFQPHRQSPPVNRLPALDNGFITFGSFNRPGKINGTTLDLWAKLLTAVPRSQMIIGAMAADERREVLAEQLAARGIDRRRLTSYARGGMESYLALHHRVDLCLDAAPYGGGTTTHHALWMGVPTLTVAGPTPSACQAAGILGVAGLDEFVAASERDFVAQGVYWAAHTSELAAVREGLRTRLLDSPGRKPEVVGAGFEHALRQAWTQWCAGKPPVSFETPMPTLIGGDDTA